MRAARAGPNVAVHEHPTAPAPLNVLIAGGGVAALEAMRPSASSQATASPSRSSRSSATFRYRPMAVAEPFTIAHARRLPLAGIAADFDAP
jgi:sulfide:quinone oxidoreductase